MAEGFSAMLQGIATAPSTPITTLPCLSKADKSLLQGFNTLPQAVRPIAGSLQELFSSQAKKTPFSIAFVEHSGRTFTYHEWDVYSSRFAMRLREAGVQPGQLVAALTEFSFEYFVAIFGIIKAGGAWLPIDPQAPVDRSNITFENNDVQFLVHLKHHSVDKFQLQGKKTFVVVPTAEVNAPGLREPDGFEMHKPAPDDLCYVICTSGSTGTPKAVMIPHRGIVNFVSWMTIEFILDTTDVGMFPLALHFDGSHHLFMMLASGAAVYLHSPASQLNMALVAEEFVKYNITVSISLPTWVNLLYASLKDQKLEKVKYIGCGGDIIPQALPDRILEASPKALFFNFYGPTECTVTSLCYKYNKSMADGRPLPIGKPILNYQVYLLDEALQQVPVGVVGEICVGGEGVALGYLKDPKMTETAFVTQYGKKLYRTGDYGRMRADGNIEFTARRDGQVKIFGYRVETGEIRNVLCKSEYVQDAVVVPVKQPSSDPNGKASYELRGFVILNEAHHKESSATMRKLVHNHLQSKLPPYMIPKLNIMTEFPYSQNGKVDTQALLKQKEDNDSDEEMDISPRGKPPKDPLSLEAQVQSVFEEALGVDSIGEKSIFDLGGNSITAVAIINKINAILGKQLPVVSIFESGGTISGLAEKLADVKPLSPHEIFINKIVNLQNQYGHKIRVQLFEHMKKNTDIFGYQEDLSINQQRDRTWRQVINLIQNKFLFYPTHETMADYDAVTEAIAMFDFAIFMLWRNQFLAVVQCFQFSGSAAHMELMQKLVNFETTGAVALSELGHGSNTALIETVATFDKSSDCFILNTPNDMAQKYWCGGASQFAEILIVVAKLELEKVDHGLHLFVIPLRDKKGNISPGITVVDCGQKMGLNNVDNGRVWFHNFKIPRVGGMLDKFSQVSRSGEYSTYIQDVHVRNAAHLGEPLLIEGRLSIAKASVTICKCSTAMAVRYASTRNQFGPNNLPIIEALAVQLRLFPHVARTWAMNFLTKFMVRVNGHPSSDPLTGYTADHIAQLSSAVKPYCAWTALQILRDCREVCGGQGYRSVNRFGKLIADAEGLCTAEGAGDLLIPIFAKSLVTESTKFTSFGNALSARLQPLTKLYNDPERQAIVAKLHETSTPHDLVDQEFQLNAFLVREFELLKIVSNFYKENTHLDHFDADNIIADELKELAFAHVERVALEQLIKIEPMVEADMLPLLNLARSTFVLDRIQNSISSYRTLQFPVSLQILIKDTIRYICGAMKEHAVNLVDGFGVPDFLLGEIGNDWLACSALPQKEPNKASPSPPF